MYINKIYLIFTGLLLVTFTNLSAQSVIKGIVRDAETNELMIGVSVAIKETQQGTITNGNGEFNLPVKQGSYTVVFSYMGYEPVTKRITCLDKKLEQIIKIALKSSAKEINEVVVTAKSEARQIQEQAMPISVITMEDIQGTVSNTSDLLSKTAGVKIKNSGGKGSESRISVRGLEGKRIGFFIDGTPITNSDVVCLNDIPIDMIERIEVYKGIVPAKFGGSAIGGAVNLVIKEYPPRYIDLNYSLQSYNTHNINTVIKRNNPDSGYEFGGGGSYTYSDNNYQMTTPEEYGGHTVIRDHDAYRNIVIGGGFKSKVWWFDEVGFEPAFTQTKKEIQGIQQNIQHATTSSEAYIIGNHLEKEDFFIEGLDFESNTGYVYTQSTYIDTAMQRYNFDGTTYAAVTTLGGEIGTDPNNAHNKKHTVGQKTNLNYVINENNSLNLNTVYNYAHGIPKDELKDEALGYKTNYESTMNSFVAGLNYEQNLFHQKLTNSLSIKYYYYNISTTLVDLYSNEASSLDSKKQDFGISDAIRYRFSSDFLIKASLAYDVRLPSEEELLGDGFLIMPSESLEPERNASINIGTMYSYTDRKKNDFQIELNLFYMQLENMIRYTGGTLQSQYLNFGEMRTLGADLEIKYDLSRYIYLFGNATYQDLRDTRETEPGTTVANPTKGDRIPNIPYLYANAGIELHKENLFGGQEQNSKYWIESSFVEEYFYDFEQSIYQERRIPRALTFNMGIEHSFKNNNASIAFQINNITNETLLSEFNRPLPGRTAGIKLRYIIR